MTELNAIETDLRARWIEATNKTENVTKRELAKFAESIGYDSSYAHTFLSKKCKRTSRGKYSILEGVDSNQSLPSSAAASINAASVVKMEPKPAEKTRSISYANVYVPEKVQEFVKWGYYSDVEKIISSKMFFPIFIAGLSGNGKTFMVEQACAHLNREYVRVQINPETDEDDLLGGFRLLNGETVFEKGPVVRAMESGAILLIDEIDRGSNKLMALQGVLEGKPILLKKTGETVSPAQGFNVIATANTRGQGDLNGRFSSATILDEAFLERFNITLAQPYPDVTIEKKIVNNHMKKFGITDVDFVNDIVKWAQAIRETYETGAIEDVISSRRLCHIVQTYSIFNDVNKAIELCVNRFEEDTREAFLDLFSKLRKASSGEADKTPAF